MLPADWSERDLSRRAFLRAGAVAFGGAVAASAAPELAWAASGTGSIAPLVLSSDLYASPDPQRFVFALGRGGKGGIQFVSGPKSLVRFRPQKGGAWTPLLSAPLDRAGLPKGRGVYVASPVFGQAGVWYAEARVSGRRVPFAVQVNDQPAVVVPGQPAPRAPSPTVSDTLGVNPICTRDPMCPLHTASLSSVIGAGKPVAALFATPARCQSQYCGPVLDELLHVMTPYKDRVTFVHIEIYQSLTGTTNVPTVTAWGLPSEPWLFGIDATGKVVSRIDGAFGGGEMKKLLGALAA